MVSDTKVDDETESPCHSSPNPYGLSLCHATEEATRISTSVWNRKTSVEAMANERTTSGASVSVAMAENGVYAKGQPAEANGRVRWVCLWELM